MSFLEGEKGAIISREEKNRQADHAFLTWAIDTRGSSLAPEVRALLTKEAREFIIQEAQQTCAESLGKEELKERVRDLRHEFERRYMKAKMQWPLRRQLQKLITDVVVPEYVFQKRESFDPLDERYNDLLNELSRYASPEKTSLRDWALGFLMSESQFIALSVLKRETVGGKLYNDLSDLEQKHLLALAGEVITRRFMSNLQAIQRKYLFGIPPLTEMAVKKRVNQFLFEKFSP